jgi:putative inorganic carbon (hco3(-)) transporter
MNKAVLQLRARLRSTEIWVMPLAVALSVLSSQVLLPIIGIFLLYRLLQWWGSGRLTLRTPIDWSIFLLLLTLPVTLSVTVQPQVTHRQIYQLLSGIAILYSLMNGVTLTSQLRFLSISAVVAGIGLACVAPFTVAWITDKFSFIPSALYTFVPHGITEQVHPNIIAGTLALLTPLAMAPLLFAWSRVADGERVIYMAGTLAMTGILVLTQSRGALMGVTAALLSLILLRWCWGWRIMVVIVSLLALTFYFVGPDLFVDQSGLSTVRGWEGRQEIWSRAFYIIQDFPFTGIGIGNFNLIADTFYPFFLAAPGQTPHAHNLFLQISVDLGIPGLIVWLSLVLIILVSSWQILAIGQMSNDGWLAGLGAGLLASQIVMLVHGVTDSVLWGTKPSVVLWFVWGIALVTLLLYQPAPPHIPGKAHHTLNTSYKAH